MDWNCGNPRPFIPPPVGQSSFAFLYNYNNDHYTYPPGVGAMMQMNQNDYENSNQERKKRLTTEQLEALENTFHEEKKLDPDTKMKLSHELGIQPRQIAVWFQNRRARWKAKQLESLYDALKQEFDAVCREKQKLQEEVLALRTILKEQVNKRQRTASSTGYTYMSGEDTVESTSVATIRTATTTTSNHHHHQLTSGQHQAAVATTAAMTTENSNGVLTYDPATSMPIPSYSNWAVLPSYP